MEKKKQSQQSACDDDISICNDWRYDRQITKKLIQIDWKDVRCTPYTKSSSHETKKRQESTAVVFNTKTTTGRKQKLPHGVGTNNKDIDVILLMPPEHPFIVRFDDGLYACASYLMPRSK